MKYLVLMPLMVLSLNVEANVPKCGCEFPKHTVKKKKYVQTKPAACEKVTVEVVREKLVYKETTVLKEVVKTVSQKNHLRLYGGVAPDGFDVFASPKLVKVTQNFAPAFGVGYGRNVSDRWSIEGVAITNGTGLLGVGYNW